MPLSTWRCPNHSRKPSTIAGTKVLRDELNIILQVRTEYGVLPVDHPKRTEAQLESAVAMLEGGNISSCADSVLKPMMEQTEQVSPQCLLPIPSTSSLQPHQLKHLSNVETRSHCPQAFLRLDLHCRDNAKHDYMSNKPLLNESRCSGLKQACMFEYCTMMSL